MKIIVTVSNGAKQRCTVCLTKTADDRRNGKDSQPPELPVPAYSARTVICTFVEKKSPARRGVCERGGVVLLFQETLEVNLATELQGSPGVGRVKLAKLLVAEAGVNVLELSVVPSVEGLEANFESAAARFVEREALE